MSIQGKTAGTRETAARAGTGRDRERSPNANVPRSSPDDKLAEAWLDANRQAVEANTFFALTIEPDASAVSGGREQEWVVAVDPRSPWQHPCHAGLTCRVTRHEASESTHRVAAVGRGEPGS
jgi:hypothetical protein